MDNTLMPGLTNQIISILDMALGTVLILAALVLGSTIGYRVYKNMLNGMSWDGEGKYQHDPRTDNWRDQNGGFHSSWIVKK